MVVPRGARLARRSRAATFTGVGSVPTPNTRVLRLASTFGPIRSATAPAAVAEEEDDAGQLGDSNAPMSRRPPWMRAAPAASVAESFVSGPAGSPASIKGEQLSTLRSLANSGSGSFRLPGPASIDPGPISRFSPAAWFSDE